MSVVPSKNNANKNSNNDSNNNNNNNNDNNSNNNNNNNNVKSKINISEPNDEKCSICKGLWYYDVNRMKAGLPPICIGDYSEIIVKPDLKTKIKSYEDYMKKKGVNSNLTISMGLNIYNKQRMITEKVLFPYKPLYENYKQNTIKPEDESNKKNNYWVDFHEPISIIIAKVPDISLYAIEKYVYLIQDIMKPKLNQKNSLQKVINNEENKNFGSNTVARNEINITTNNKLTSKEFQNDKNKDRLKYITDKTVEYFFNPDELLKRIGVSAGIEFPQVSTNLVIDLMHKSKEKVCDVIAPSIKLFGNTMIYSVFPNIYRNLKSCYDYYTRK